MKIIFILYNMTALFFCHQRAYIVNITFFYTHFSVHKYVMLRKLRKFKWELNLKWKIERLSLFSFAVLYTILIYKPYVKNTFFLVRLLFKKYLIFLSYFFHLIFDYNEKKEMKEEKRKIWEESRKKLIKKKFHGKR